MTAKQLILTVSTFVLAGSLMLTSCKKKNKEEEDIDNDQTEASENNLAESMMNDVAGIGSQGSENGSLSTYRTNGPNDIFMGPCATVSLNATAKTFTVDFGATPCLCLDGKYRSGKLIFDYSLSTNTITPIYYRTPGFKMSVASSNYVVDGYTVNIGSKTIENTTPNSIPTGTNPGTNLTWSISASVSIIKPNNGGTITWNCNRTKTLLNTSDPNCYQGQSMPIMWNKAKISLSGSANGTTASGNNYTSTITNIVRDFGGCKINGRYPFISGKIDFTPGTKATRYIDFGNGSCDNSGTITIKGITYTFNF
jgi:hypothetical protein